MKTAVTALQEMMMKLGELPEYECIAQSGPAHSALFEYRCRAGGVTVVGAARSKREAKQQAAAAALTALEARGQRPGGNWRAAAPPPPADQAASSSAAAPRTHVALLKELCDEYRLGGVEYDLVSDTGPAHQRHFTVRARLGRHERDATATTKKAARQMAAEQLYRYLRENLSRVTRDFVEEEALVRANEKAMERYVPEETPWRPDLGQRVAEYHIGVLTHTEPQQREAARRALATEGTEAERALQEAAAALGAELEWAELPTDGGGALQVVTLSPGAPPLTLAGGTRSAAAALALRCLHMQLRERPLPMHRR